MNELTYSAMSEQELRQEIANLRERARKAEQLGIVNEYAVYERKALMAEAYLVDLESINLGEMYRINGSPGEFSSGLFKGRFAWGHRLGSERLRSFTCFNFTSVKGRK